MEKVDLSKFDKKKYKHGASIFKYYLWHLVNQMFFIYPVNPSSRLKVFWLRLFGAKVGKGVVMNKPNINIKYPWRLEIGDYVWLGENTWIYNMDDIKIGNHVNIAQGAMLLTGNHNYKSPTFDVMTAPITIEDGVFIGAKAVVCPGVRCHSHSLLTVGSIATHNMEAYTIYQGNPAKKIRERVIQ